MSDIRGRGRLSSIELLPRECDEIVAWAAQELADRTRTQLDIYAEFADRCATLKDEFEGGIDFTVPSFSSFNRFALRQASLNRRLEETREIASTMAARFDAQGSDDLTRIAAEAIKTLVFEVITSTGDAGLDPKGAMQLASALKSAAQAQGISTDRRLKVEREFEAQVSDAVTKVAKVRGLTAETAEAIKAQILGVTT